jgi:hypothetical protein
MILHLPGLATLQDRLLWLFVLLATAKFLSTTTLVLLGDYRAVPSTRFRRFTWTISKVTPFLMCLAAGSLEFERGHWIKCWGLIACSLFAAGFAASIVRLRSQGRFHGAADWMLRYLSPWKVKVALVSMLGILLLLTLRVSWSGFP